MLNHFWGVSDLFLKCDWLTFSLKLESRVIMAENSLNSGYQLNHNYCQSVCGGGGDGNGGGGGLVGLTSVPMTCVADKMLADGESMANIQDILSQAATVEGGAQGSGDAPPSSSTSGSARSAAPASGEQQGWTQRPAEPLPASQGSQAAVVVARGSGRIVTEVEVDDKSRFIIEIERDDEEEDSGGGPSGDGGSQPRAPEASERRHVAPRGDPRGASTGAGQQRWGGASSDPPRSARSPGSNPLDLSAGQSVGCAQRGDEVDGGGITADGEAVEVITIGEDGETIAACEVGGFVTEDGGTVAVREARGVMDAGDELGRDENHAAEAADVSDRMALVITSVTSLRDANINFDDGRVEANGEGAGDEGPSDNIC